MTGSDRLRRFPWASGGVVATLVAGHLALASIADAQTYNQLKFNPDAIKTGNRSTTRGILGGAPLQPNIKVFQEYYANVFARMTQTASIGSVGDMRWALLTQIRGAKSADALAEFNRIALIGANKICKGNYHPAACYNIALIVGDLDQELSSGFGSSAKPPVPLPEAVPVLLGFISDAQVIDAVKVAALIGLHRHARYGLSPQMQASVSQAMQTLLAEKEPPGSRTPEGHLWMRRRATDVLGAMGEPGKQNEVLTALQTVLADEVEETVLRCTVADAIGRLKFAPNVKIDADNLVGQLGDLAVAILTEEVAVAEQQLKTQESTAAGFGGVGRSGMFAQRSRGYDESGFGFTDETEGEGVFPRRRLAARLATVRRGLAAVKPLAGEQPKALGDNMAKWLDAVQKLVEDTRQDDATLITEVTRIRGDIEGAIRKGQTPVTPAAAEPAVEKSA